MQHQLSPPRPRTFYISQVLISSCNVKHSSMILVPVKMQNALSCNRLCCSDVFITYERKSHWIAIRDLLILRRKNQRYHDPCCYESMFRIRSLIYFSIKGLFFWSILCFIFLSRCLFCVRNKLTNRYGDGRWFTFFQISWFHLIWVWFCNSRKMEGVQFRMQMAE